MNLLSKKSLRAILVVALAVATVAVIYNPGLETVLASLTCIGALVGVEVNGRKETGHIDLDDRESVFSELSKEERIALFEEWKLLKAEYQVPKYEPLSIEKQQERESIKPIDLSPINNLFNYLNMSGFELCVPQTSDEFRKTHNCRPQAIDIAAGKIQKTFEGGTQRDPIELRQLLDSMYDYLAEEDQDFGRADIAIVPGYRQVYRAEKAGELYKEGKVRKLYLTGGKPFYDKSSAKQLSEALAMEIFLSDIRGLVSRNSIYVDLHAEDTKQNIQYSTRPFFEERKLVERQLDVVIVTSPYHMRRTSLLVEQLSDTYPQLIGRIFRVCSSAKFVRENWFESKAGITAYFTEFWKLQGGRVVGEF